MSKGRFSKKSEQKIPVWLLIAAGAVLVCLVLALVLGGGNDDVDTPLPGETAGISEPGNTDTTPDAPHETGNSMQNPVASGSEGETGEAVTPSSDATEAVSEPTQGNTGSTNPTQGNTGSTNPTQGNTGSTNPTQGNTGSTNPTQGNTGSTEPTQGNTGSTEPTQGNTGSTEPTQGNTGSTEPTQGNTGSTEPTQGNTGSTEPTQGNTGTSEPTDPPAATQPPATEPSVPAFEIVEMAKAEYEKWLSAAMVICISMEYPDFELEGIYIASATSLENKYTSEGAYVIFSSGGQRLALHSLALMKERTTPGTKDISTEAIGFATYDFVNPDSLDLSGMVEVPFKDLEVLISQSLLVSIYEH